MIKDIIVRFTQYWLIWLGAIVVILVMGFRGGVLSILVERLLPWRPTQPMVTRRKA